MKERNRRSIIMEDGIFHDDEYIPRTESRLGMKEKYYSYFSYAVL